MKIVKLKASDYKNISSFYKRNNLISGNEQWSQIRPWNVYISKEDAKRFRKELYNRAKKEGIRGIRNIEMAVGMEWLNLGPNESLSEAIRPGYAVINEEDGQQQFNNDLKEILEEA